jgi:hypothetical protein
MIGSLLVALPTRCFGVRVGFVSCGTVALLALILLPLFGRES